MKGTAAGILLMVLIITSSCALSTLQSANTVKPGKMSFFMSGAMLNMDGVSTAGTFIPDVGARIGLTKNMDFGIRLFALGAFGDLKYAFFQSRHFGPSLAIIGGFGLNSLGDTKMYAIDVGPIFSLKLGRLVNPYVSLKYRRFGFINATSSSSSSSNILSSVAGDFVTASLGIELFPDSKISILLEANQFFDTSGNGGSFTVFNGGLKFNI